MAVGEGLRAKTEPEEIVSKAVRAENEIEELRMFKIEILIESYLQWETGFIMLLASPFLFSIFSYILLLSYINNNHHNAH